MSLFAAAAVDADFVASKPDSLALSQMDRTLEM